MVTRKTVLKRLEHINLAEWRDVNSVDNWIESRENNLNSRKLGSRYAPTKILSAMDLVIYELWRIPSTKLPLDKVFRIALEAGKEYTCTPGVAPGSNCPHDEFWLDEMTSLIVIASLQEGDAELTRCSNWFKVEEYALGHPSELALQPILYYVADMFRDKKFVSFEKLNKFLASCRITEPPLLVSALAGIRSCNSKKAFDNLIDAGKDHAKRTKVAITKDQVINQRTIVALYPSLLWNVAEHRGLEPPTMPPEIRPFMLTRQTLGLSPIQTVIPSESTILKASQSVNVETEAVTAGKVFKSSSIIDTETVKDKKSKRKVDEIS